MSHGAPASAAASVPEAGTTFSQVSAVSALDEGCFEATIAPEWTIGGKPNGGYLLAMLGRAATASSPHADVISASSYYLRAPEPGPVVIEAEMLRAGRSASHVRARMTQGGEPCVEALVLTGELDASSTPYWDRGLPEPVQARYEACPRLMPRIADGVPVAIMEQIEVRLDPQSSGFTRGQPSGQGELRGWLALPGGEDFDATGLLFAVDAYPPGTFNVELAGWVPTLELTVYVRALPEPGPVRVLQRAELIEGRRVDESCYVWDQGGRLVAQGRQLAGIRLG